MTKSVPRISDLAALLASSRPEKIELEYAGVERQSRTRICSMDILCRACTPWSSTSASRRRGALKSIVEAFDAGVAVSRSPSDLPASGLPGRPR